jgi:hypothetical protein
MHGPGDERKHADFARLTRCRASSEVVERAPLGPSQIEFRIAGREPCQSVFSEISRSICRANKFFCCPTFHFSISVA